MKKSLLIAVVVIACVAMAAPVFALQLKGPTQSTPIPTTTIIGSAAYVPSTNVVVNACSTPTNYAVASMHNSSLHSTGGRSFQATTDPTQKQGILYLDVSGASAAEPTCSGTSTDPQASPPILSSYGDPL
jgi:hypothetical protein